MSTPTLKRIYSKFVKSPIAAAQTELRRLNSRSDFQRWSDVANLHAAWDARTIQLGTMIPQNARVLEFGAGRLVLAQHLPAGCTYTPSDLVDRGPGTIVCDLNADLPAFPAHDVAVYSGVFEYIHDLPRLLRHLNSPSFLVSYNTDNQKTAPNRVKRRSKGWMNDYDLDEFLDLMSTQGYHCHEKRHWKGAEFLFQFQQNTSPQNPALNA